MDYGIGIPSYIDAWREVQAAEAAGFTNAWFYDSQLIYSDVYATMALAAQRQLGADVGVGVTGLTTGSGESRAPLGTSYTGFALGDDTSSVAGHYPTRRLRLRGSAATHALVELIRLLRG